MNDAAVKLHASPPPDPAKPTTSAAPDVATLRNQVFALVCKHMRTLAGRHAADYEDLVQTAAERVLKDLPSFEGRSTLSTWTFRVCYSVLLTERRWYKRWLSRFTLTREGELPDPPDVDSAGENSGEWLERAERVRAAVERLPPKKRVVVTMHDLRGTPIEEIAELLDTNVLTVRSRLRDGRRQLAQRLAKDPYFGDEACASAWRKSQ